MMQRQVQIISDGRRLAASLFLPDGKPSGAILLAPPFAEERKGALPVMAEAARKWARRGAASLYFDYAGTGSSDGAFEEIAAGQFARDAAAAWAFLRNEFPGIPLAALGVRASCCLLAEAAAGASAIVEWAPIGGGDFMRQLLQRRMVNDMVAYGKARESRGGMERRFASGEAVDLDGFVFTAALYKWIDGLRLPPPSESAFAPDLRIPPFWNAVGRIDMSELLSATDAWLAPRLAMNAECGAPASDAKAPELRIAFDRPVGKPVGGALFLHGWSGDGTGPHRMFTRFARQLARRGILSARPDFIGRGLSDGAASDASIARMAANAEEALARLRAELPEGAPVSAIAICSGCKVAITLAASHPELRQLVLWSAESMGSLRAASTGLRKMLHALRAYAGKLAKPETWKKIFGGKVNASFVAKALVKQEKRSPAEARAEDETLQRFRAFRGPVFFAFGGSDPDAPGSSAAYAHFCRKNGIPFSMHVIPNAGHSYYGEAWTEELFAETEKHFQMEGKK